MNRERQVYLNGRQVDEGQALISAFDRGFLFGDGVFETLRAYNGRLFAFDRHMDRLFKGLELLRIEIPEAALDLEEACLALLEGNVENDAALRITVSRGRTEGPLGLTATTRPTRLISFRDLALPTSDQYEKGVHVHPARAHFAKPAFLQGMKNLNYLLHLAARQEAIDTDCFEALLLNERGELVEGSVSNLFVVFGDIVKTPPPSSGALPGVTRAICLDLLRDSAIDCREEVLFPAALADATEVFLTNSVIEIVPVVDVGANPVGNGSPGPVTRSLAKKYRELVGRKTAKPR